MTFTLLWAEDDPNDLLLGERALLKVGFEKPMVVRDGEQAVSYLSGKDEFADRGLYPIPSLMLLDLKLPKLSGFEVLRWIRGEAGLKRIPVVILSSSQERQDIDRAYDYGVNAYLVKPVDSQKFVDVVRRLHLFWVEINTSPETALKRPHSSSA